MENVLLITASRQVALQREMDVVANNVANAQTNGFKRRMTRLEEFKMPVASEEAFPKGSDRRVSFVLDQGTMLDTSGGMVEPTGNPLDIALSENVYLAVSTPQGERYTRNGALMLNASGTVVTSDGYPVMGGQGSIQILPHEKDLRVGADGVMISNAGEREKLRLVKFTDDRQLESIGGNLMAAKTLPQVAENARVMSGMLERSNVRPVLEISRMMEITRQYQSIATLMGRHDDSRRSAIQKLGEPI